MASDFLPKTTKAALEGVLASGDNELLFDLLAQPLHEELYKRQNFDLFDELSEAQQLLISYDYLRTNVLQGGFIQFLVNGYVGLLPDMPAWLENIGAGEMGQVIDDVLKVYVLNVQMFSKEMSTKEFGNLYEELKEFEILDERFTNLNKPTVDQMMTYAKEHLTEYIELL